MAARTIAPAVAAMLLVACGSGDKQTTTITAPSGEVATAVTGSNVALPGDLPKWAARYPGAKIVSVIATDRPDANMRMITMSTPDPVSKVVAFYDARMAAAGIRAAVRQDGDDTSTRMLGDGPTMQQLVVGKGSDATEINLNYAAPGSKRP